ncbi:MAG TPA: hypothetical protein VGD66_02675 [Allosphingosinicella sp.]|jgi:hypothetical protein
MVRRLLIAVIALGAAVPAAAQRSSLGVFGAWGGFREPGRCYAIAEAEGPQRSGERAFAAVSWWPARGVRGQLHFRFERPKRPGSAVLLRIDGRTFQLIGGGGDAWAPDARADAEIVAAMRTGIDMSVETRSGIGGLVRDSYRLRGAASAIDAAAIGCARG